MADLLGAIVIAAGTVVAAYINASGYRSKGKGGAQKPRQPAKAKRRKAPAATTSRAAKPRGNSFGPGSTRQRGG